MGRDRNRPRPESGGWSSGRLQPAASTSWDPLAQWYNGWVGENGSEHHRRLAVPAVLDLLAPQRGDRIVDVGCGQGVIAPAIHEAGADYIGVDASPRLIDLAQKIHGDAGRFLVGDARNLQGLKELRDSRFDGAVFLLSLQDMDPLGAVIASAASILKEWGRLILLLTHPAFRIPRQSGWGWDEGRKLVFRRVDRYLTPLPVPLKALPGKDSRATTRSFHRPLQEYVNALGENSIWTDRVVEIPGYKLDTGHHARRADELARTEIPLFLGLRAIKTPARGPESRRAPGAIVDDAGNRDSAPARLPRTADRGSAREDGRPRARRRTGEHRRERG